MISLVLLKRYKCGLSKHPTKTFSQLMWFPHLKLSEQSKRTLQAQQICQKYKSSRCGGRRCLAWMFNKMCHANRNSHTTIANTHTAADLKKRQEPISYVNCSITATEGKSGETFLQLTVMLRFGDCFLSIYLTPRWIWGLPPLVFSCLSFFLYHNVSCLHWNGSIVWGGSSRGTEA